MYKLELKPSALRDLLRLPRLIQKRVAEKIDALAKDPFPRGSTKLEALDDLWRIRIGDYRVVYEIDNRAKTVDVTRIAHRRAVNE